MAVAPEIIGHMTKRDARSMNHMDPDTKWVHTRLEEWAPYARDKGIAGYPHQSLTERAAKYGQLGLPQESNFKPEPLMPDAVAQVDLAVCRLGEIDRKVITLYYLSWEPVEALAKRAAMRVRQFQNVLSRARSRVAGFLDALEAQEERKI